MEAWISPPAEHDNNTEWTTQYLVKNCFVDPKKEVLFPIGRFF